MTTTTAPTPTTELQSADVPARPRSLITEPLGVYGWTELEPIILAALASEEPMLLIGSHGTAKSLLLQRLAEALGITFRFYNASLINYDDLVGIPLPAPDNRSLVYIGTATAIWDAEAVFIDELNRTRPDLQNKVFPIIHERRVQGVLLEKLRYRWAAINPPPTPETPAEAEYIGTDPLDPALADRFAFIIETPSWEKLQPEDRVRLLVTPNPPIAAAQESVRSLVAAARRHLDALRTFHPPELPEYVATVVTLMNERPPRYSTRRAAIIFRNILAIHAARLALASAQPDYPTSVVDWETSGHLALLFSDPLLAITGQQNQLRILTAHRQARALLRDEPGNTWRDILLQPTALKRLAGALRNPDALDGITLGQLITDAVAAETDPRKRMVVAAIVFHCVRGMRKLPPAIIESLSQVAGSAISPNIPPQIKAPDSSDVWCRIAPLLQQRPRTKKDRLRIAVLAELMRHTPTLETVEQCLQHFELVWATLRRDDAALDTIDETATMKG